MKIVLCRILNAIAPRPSTTQTTYFLKTLIEIRLNRPPSIPQTHLHRPQLTTLKNLKTKKPKLQVAPSDRVLNRKK